MKLQIKITRNNSALKGVTAIIVDGPGEWSEIAAISNEFGELSLNVQKEGSYRVRLMLDQFIKTITVRSDQKLEIAIP